MEAGTTIVSLGPAQMRNSGLRGARPTSLSRRSSTGRSRAHRGSSRARPSGFRRVRAGTTLRALQRLFAEHGGIGPKSVIRRYRLHEVSRRLEAGRELGWPHPAADLSYADRRTSASTPA